ncbi:MAG: YbjN domain-containing protein [Clostridia bacterium]|nr:YbjN domain-containing protein [Clostridia bacterium]
MLHFAQMFVDYMDQEDIKYTVSSDNVIKVTYTGDNLDSIPVYVIFDEEGDEYVEFKCWDIANFKSREAKAIEVCNELNAKYRWVKFYMDSDKDIIVSIDAVVDSATCGEECLSLVRRVVNITDEAYPEIAKARWA